MPNYNVDLKVTPAKGGYVLDYPVKTAEGWNYITEVVSTSRKAIQRIKEIIKSFDEINETCSAETLLQE